MTTSHLLLFLTFAGRVLAECGDACNTTQELHNPVRAPRSSGCPPGCPYTGKPSKYATEFSFTPLGSEVTLTVTMKTPIGKSLQKQRVVKAGETMHVDRWGLQREGQGREHLQPPMEGFNLSGNVRYCHRKSSRCLTTTTTAATTTTTTTSPTTTTTTTTTTTSTTTTTTTPTTTATTTTAAPTVTPNVSTTAESIQEETPWWEVETLLLTLSVASVLLRLVFVVKGSLHYRKTLAGLDRTITAFELSPRTCLSRLYRLYLLRNAMVLNFGLRVLLCLLVPCLCACACSLYLTLAPRTHGIRQIYVAFYMLGAVCLLLHGFFCIRKVNGVISTLLVAQHSPMSPIALRRPQHRRRHRTSEESLSLSSERLQGGCSQAVIDVLKMCLLMLLLSLCLLSYCLYRVVKGRDK